MYIVLDKLWFQGCTGKKGLRKGGFKLREEGYVEQWLGIKVRQLGCLYYKFVSPGNAGVPDRLLVLPDGRVWFVELKDAAGRLSREDFRLSSRGSMNVWASARQRPSWSTGWMERDSSSIDSSVRKLTEGVSDGV